jgi:cell division transport system permease protein
LRALAFFIQEGWSSLRRNPAATLAAVTALGAVLFVLLLFLLISHNVLVLADRLAERKGLSVFLDTSLTPERVAELQQHFQSFPEVKALQLITRAEALADVEADLGTGQIEEILDGNPLPDTFLITPVPAASDAVSLERLAREMEAYAGVEDVLYGRRWIEALDQGLRMAYHTTWLTGGLAMLAIILVLANTLRLLVLMREDQLYVMKMIGATDHFLRAPFVTAGALLCALGGAIALLLLYAGHYATRALLPGVRFLPWLWMLGYFLGVVLVGSVGSWLTLQASLRTFERKGDTGYA